MPTGSTCYLAYLFSWVPDLLRWGWEDLQKFRSRYRGAGICECHHQVAINQGERKTHLNDLHIVCANCHRMIHNSDPMLTIAELRNILRPRRRHDRLRTKRSR